VAVGDWNLISRPIIPIIDVGGVTTGIPGVPIDPTDPDLAGLGSAAGLGDEIHVPVTVPAKKLSYDTAAVQVFSLAESGYRAPP